LALKMRVVSARSGVYGEAGVLRGRNIPVDPSWGNPSWGNSRISTATMRGRDTWIDVGSWSPDSGVAASGVISWLGCFRAPTRSRRGLQHEGRHNCPARTGGGGASHAGRQQRIRPQQTGKSPDRPAAMAGKFAVPDEEAWARVFRRPFPPASRCLNMVSMIPTSWAQGARRAGRPCARSAS